jgi:hypothetical protein
MLVTEAAFLVLALRMAVGTIGARLDWLATCAAPLVAGAAMAGATLALRHSPWLALAAGLAVYSAVFVLAERAINPSDLAFVRDFARRRIGLLRRRTV